MLRSDRPGPQQEHRLGTGSNTINGGVGGGGGGAVQTGFIGSNPSTVHTRCFRLCPVVSVNGLNPDIVHIVSDHIY